MTNNILSMQNGLLNLDDLLAGKSPEAVMMDHTPEWFSEVKLPYRFDHLAECPRFMRFLEQVMENDPDRIALLQEWAGYCLTPDVSQHRFAVFVGEGGNGKNVFLDILEALLGPDNVSHVGLELFAVRFQLWDTVGKLANFVSEVGELEKVAEGIFKAFVSGDALHLDRKMLKPITIRPTARVTIATNTKPRWADRSEGIWRRMLIVPFNVTIPDERQDKNLAKHIINDEMPGVFNWAVKGLARLRARGRFEPPKVCQEALAEYRVETNPARSFLTEECEVSAQSWVVCKTLYRAYVQWCTEGGYRPLSDRAFGKEVQRVFKAERKQETVNHCRCWCYMGIEARPQEEAVA